MHGNTIKSPNGYKTRSLTSFPKSSQVLRHPPWKGRTVQRRAFPEMTGRMRRNVSAARRRFPELDLSNCYHTHYDPRLNASQSLELAFLIAEIAEEAELTRTHFSRASYPHLITCVFGALHHLLHRCNKNIVTSENNPCPPDLARERGKNGRADMSKVALLLTFFIGGLPWLLKKLLRKTAKKTSGRKNRC